MKKYKNVFEGSRCKFLHETVKTLSKTRHPLSLAFSCALRPVASGYGGFRGVLGVPPRAGAEPRGVRRYKPEPIFKQADPSAPELHQHGSGADGEGAPHVGLVVDSEPCERRYPGRERSSSKHKSGCSAAARLRWQARYEPNKPRLG